jgi:V/A-type H+-transporting ATPase subunit E
MAIDSILNHIVSAAESEAEAIIKKAQADAHSLAEKTQRESDVIYKKIMDKEHAACETHKKALIVDARLEAKKEILKARQEIIDEVFNRLKSQLPSAILKKQQVYADKIKESSLAAEPFIEHLRQRYDADIARILFG